MGFGLLGAFGRAGSFSDSPVGRVSKDIYIYIYISFLLGRFMMDFGWMLAFTKTSEDVFETRNNFEIGIQTEKDRKAQLEGKGQDAIA